MNHAKRAWGKHYILSGVLLNVIHFFFIDFFLPGALHDILMAFKEADNVRRLEEARDAAGNDMLRAMQIVFPVASQIEMEVIERYGFPRDGDGMWQFIIESTKTTVKSSEEEKHVE